MSVRTKLVVAFLLLAVLPLVGIVLFSYLTSGRAFRRAVEAESRVLAQEMSDRLDDVRSDIQRRLLHVATLPEVSILPGNPEDESRVSADLMIRMEELGEMADWLEFTPQVVPEVPETPEGEPILIHPSAALSKAIGRLAKQAEQLAGSGLSADYLDLMIEQALQRREVLEEQELQALEERRKETERLLGTEFTSPVERAGQVVGSLKAQVPATQILRRVLARTPRDQGEIPFARDSEGVLLVERTEDQQQLESIGVGNRLSGPERTKPSAEWIVVETEDEESGLTFGVARPVAAPLREIRRTAVRNLVYGLCLVALAMLGVLWLSHRMTRNLTLLTRGAEDLAEGRLKTRVAVRSRDEFGRLAETFNRMAGELEDNQRRLIDEERRRKEQEIQQRLLEAENERKSRELEEARTLQMSLLPKELPRHPGLDISVFMRTAAEVGGDYYDFFPNHGGAMTAVIGDAAGHGLRAGTMVTVVKGLLTAEVANSDLSALLSRATRAIKQMNLGRMNMALTLARFEDGRLLISAAGMPPALIHRIGTDSIEEVALVGTPLGSMADAVYQEWQTELRLGDTVLLMTDGLPELIGADDEPLGYTRVRELFAEHADLEPAALTEVLAGAATRWSATSTPNDDITLLAIRIKESA